MPFRATFSLVAASIVLSGCSALSAINPFASKDAPRNPPAALADFKASLNVKTVWKSSVGKAGDYTFSPAVTPNGVYAAAADGTLVRIELTTGREVWRMNTDSRLTAGVGSDGETVAVVGSDGLLMVYDSDGKQRWKTQLSSETLSAPAVGQGLVITRSIDNRIVAFDAMSGTRKWTVQRTVPPLTLRTAPGIVIAGPFAYVALPGGRLVAIALANGAVRWEAAVGDPRGATELERVADVSGSPAIFGREVCAVAYQGRVGCLDAASGNGRWAKDFSSDVGVSVDDRHVYAANERGIVHAFTRDTGASVWRNDKLMNRRLSAPVVFGKAVAVGDAQGYMHFLSREDGSFVARTETDGSRIVSAPVAVGGGVLVQTQSGTLFAFAAN
ncbi:MAG: outer membrane protein assembly factor BamB [Burkholderiaceae bacterium]